MVLVKYRLGLWRAFIDVLQSQKYWMNDIAAEYGITPQMSHALHVIPAAGSITMKALATELWCDASNATGIVDRLQSGGLVERRPAEHDRRVKCVALTGPGKRLRRKLEERFEQSPPALAALSEADQKQLAELLERTLDNAAQQRNGES